MSKVVIDAAFLRKRAEHNDGCLTTLEEVALHQLNIEKIENFDKLIRHIKILMLQNNLISKMENLTKLKEVTYLNLALNNIEKIEGLEGSESLEKLDMTCNFIQLSSYFESLCNLKKVPSLRELHLMGNPCTEYTSSLSLAGRITKSWRWQCSHS
jgi:protein TilB